MAEQFANKRKNIKPGLWFKNLEPQITERFANERNCYEKLLWFQATFFGCGPGLPKLPSKQKTIAKKAP